MLRNLHQESSKIHIRRNIWKARDTQDSYQPSRNKFKSTALEKRHNRNEAESPVTIHTMSIKE